MLTLKRLKELYKYDPESGLFFRNKTTGRWKKGSIAGTKHKTGYVHIKIDGKVYRAHRLAWLYMTGEMPSQGIDHINHIKADNRIVNLRDVSQSENTKNSSLQSNNTSGCSGVCFCNRAKKWYARIKVDGKQLSLGYHTEFSDAVNARKNAEVLYGFHENHGKDK